MGRPAWQIEERRDNLWMHTETDLDKFQIHNIMGRIYGEIWRNSDRRKYTVKDIHDEFMSRWKKGHRHDHYRIIDPESGVYDIEETNARNNTRNRVIAATAQTGGSNWLKEDDDGGLASMNAPIAFNLVTVPYVRDPSTFDAAFASANGTGLPARVTGGGRASSETPSAGSSTPTRSRCKRKTPVPSPHVAPKRSKTARSTPIEDDGSTEAGSDNELAVVAEEELVDDNLTGGPEHGRAGGNDWWSLLGVEDGDRPYEPFADEKPTDWPSEENPPPTTHARLCYRGW
ncbi:uncharacterized protein RHO25_007322 [Cercospora beticola]|uniref:Uncharacterized protein n=1 Tax=Cercospora beticola TaxID=122368 RepID=A0ABZ0NT25_CERBT|nr:hypothetical protein RHO25_007322 [Cercospora beticola]